MIFLYVAVVVMAGTLPIGFFLGRWYAEAQAEARRPLPPHVILTELRGPLGLGDGRA